MYTLIEHKKLSGTTASISFSSIPQIYTDLYLVLSASTNRNENVDVGRLAFNNTTGNWSNRQLIGFGSGNGYTETGSTSYGIFYGITGNAASTNTFGNTAIYIPNYTASTPKSVSMDWNFEANVTGAWNGLTAALWNQSASISSIQLSAEFGSFVQYSSATLYGINRGTALGKPKAIGGNITYSNGYWYHTFTGSGTFYANEAFDADALIVAGGGGGGREGAGGGAGGYIATNLSITAKSNTPVVVGSGGPGMVPQRVASVGNGNNSSLLGATAIGGGGGGGYNDGFGGAPLGATGGSGGGTWGQINPYNAPGTAGQGNSGGAGGNYTAAYGEGAGGGGGAGASGTNGISGSIPNGGAGLRWVNGTFYAGGGGGYGSQAGPNNHTGGAGGIGGGGAGGYSSASFINGTSGTANTGGGGGGGSYINSITTVGAAGAGGSGVVIIRYRAD